MDKKKNGKPKIAVVRVSSDGQAKEDRHGIARQRAALRGMGVPDEAIIEVVGVSGADLADAPEWNDRILPAIRAGADLYADEVSRVIRAKNFDFRTLEALRVAGASLHTPGRTYSFSKSHDSFASKLYASIAGLELSINARRMLEGKEVAVGLGVWTGGKTPPGIKYRPVDPDKPRVRTWQVTGEAPMMGDAFRAVADGQPVKTVARRMGWSDTRLRNILRSPLYKGIAPVFHAPKEDADEAPVDTDDLVPDVGRPEPGHRVMGGDGQPPQIVPDDVWTAVQMRLAGNKEAVRKIRAAPRPWAWASGYVVSDVLPVDVPMHEAARHRLACRQTAGGPRYACGCTWPARRFAHRCKMYWRADKLNPLLDAALSALTSDPKTLCEVREFLHGDTGEAPRIARERAAVEKTLSDLGKADKRIADGYESGVYAASEARERRAKIAEKKVEAEKTLAGLVTPPVVSPDAVDAVAAAWKFDPAWEPAVKTAWLSRYVQAIHVDRTGVLSVSLRFTSEDGRPVFAPVACCDEYRERAA